MKEFVKVVYIDNSIDKVVPQNDLRLEYAVVGNCKIQVRDTEKDIIFTELTNVYKDRIASKNTYFIIVENTIVPIQDIDNIPNRHSKVPVYYVNNSIQIIDQRRCLRC